jgi:hypothetical protein
MRDPQPFHVLRIIAQTLTGGTRRWYAMTCFHRRNILLGPEKSHSMGSALWAGMLKMRQG